MIYCHTKNQVVSKEIANCRDYGDWPSSEFVGLKADEVCQSCPFNKPKPKLDIDKWKELRIWLKNLLTLKITKKSAKSGIRIALNCMDRIDEAAE